MSRAGTKRGKDGAHGRLEIKREEKRREKSDVSRQRIMDLREEIPAAIQGQTTASVNGIDTLERLVRSCLAKRQRDRTRLATQGRVIQL